VLFFGLGNPGRGDDGLGPALAELVEGRRIPGVTVDADYQLTVEDSVAVAEHDLVVFADADATGPAPCSLVAVPPSAGGVGFSTHGAEPGGVLLIAAHAFDRRPEAWLLGIRGYEFDLSDRLTPGARANLALALDLVVPLLRGERTFAEAAAAWCPGNG
jgi:hydrogenase maturation protease